MTVEDNEDKTEVSMCIGTFDSLGIPIVVARQWSECATVAFQTISLTRLVASCLSLDPPSVAYIHVKDGSSIRIERTLKGFTGYLETSRRECR